MKKYFLLLFIFLCGLQILWAQSPCTNLYVTYVAPLSCRFNYTLGEAKSQTRMFTDIYIRQPGGPWRKLMGPGAECGVGGGTQVSTGSGFSLFPGTTYEWMVESIYKANTCPPNYANTTVGGHFSAIQSFTTPWCDMTTPTLQVQWVNSTCVGLYSPGSDGKEYILMWKPDGSTVWRKQPMHNQAGYGLCTLKPGKWYKAKMAFRLCGNPNFNWVTNVVHFYTPVTGSSANSSLPKNMEIAVDGSDDERISEGALEIYPNPAKGQFRMKFHSEISVKSNIVVFDAMGRGVIRESFMSNAGSNIRMVDISKLTKGIYAVKLTTGTETITEKLIVE